MTKQQQQRPSKIRKSSKAANDNNSFSLTNFTYRYVKVIHIKIFGALLVLILGLLVYRRSTSAIRNLVNADAAQLREAIFGDFPHLFYCDRQGGAKTNIPKIFSELNDIKGSSFGFAAVNCSQVLPSGKDLWERFKLKREWRPTIWGTAPWMKPQQAGPSYLKDTVSLRKFVDTVMAPKPTEVHTGKDLNKFCGFDKAEKAVIDENQISETCIVIMRGKKYAKLHADMEKRLVLEFPKARVAALDAAKRRLSFEDNNAPAGAASELIPADAFALKLFALRNGTHFMPMVNPATSDYMRTFATRAVGAALYDYTPVPVAAAAEAEHTRGSSSGSGSKSPKKTTSTAVEKSGVIDIVKVSSASNKSKSKKEKGPKRGKGGSKGRKSARSSLDGNTASRRDTGLDEEDDLNFEPTQPQEQVQQKPTGGIDPKTLEAVKAAAAAAQAERQRKEQQEAQLERERRRREEMDRQQRQHLYDEDYYGTGGEEGTTAGGGGGGEEVEGDYVGSGDFEDDGYGDDGEEDDEDEIRGVDEEVIEL